MQVKNKILQFEYCGKENDKHVVRTILWDIDPKTKTRQINKIRDFDSISKRFHGIVNHIVSDYGEVAFHEKHQFVDFGRARTYSAKCIKIINHIIHY